MFDLNSLFANMKSELENSVNELSVGNKMSIDFDAIRNKLQKNVDDYLNELLEDAEEELSRRRVENAYNRVWKQSIVRTDEIQADIIGDDDHLQMYSDELDIKINQETSKIWNKYKL